MDRVLLVGGAGYIGSHINYELCDLGYEVTVYDNLSTGFQNNVNPRSKFIKGSIFDTKLLDEVLLGIDVVIHLAALKDAGESMLNPSSYAYQNIEGSLAIIKSCIKNNVKKIVFSSTAAVYGLPNYLPIDELHPTNPINYYGYTKLCIEQNLFWVNKLHGIKVACLRYFNAAGYDIEGRIKIPEANPSNLLPLVMETLIGKREQFQIFGNDYDTSDGTCLRDYIHVKDLALAHLKSIECLEHSKEPMVLNLATGLSSSVLDVINMAQDISGKKIAYEFVDRRLGDPPELYSQSISANKLLNWYPEYSDLKTILESMWQVYKKL
jgi:UDP-glucose 4-epimerase